MARGPLYVTGYKETARAFLKCNLEARAALYAGLKHAAMPIALDARQRISRYSGASTSTIAPRVTTRGVYVTQRARKVTGKRPDFGGLQMTKGLIPAAYDHLDDIEHDVEAAYIGLFSREGF